MTMQTPVQVPMKERAREAFKTITRCITGRGHHCSGCGWVGQEQVIQTAVAFALSERNAVIEECVNSSERAAESITKMVDMWLEKMNLPTSNKEGKQLFTQTVQDLIAAAIRSNAREQMQ